MALTYVFIALAAACVVWYIVTTLRIFVTLQNWGQPVSFLWLRFMAPKYAGDYRRITKMETGKTGPFFFHWIISINLALVFVILAIITGL